MNVPKAEKEAPLVLIVERDRFFRKYMETFFKESKCEHEFAADGVTALKRIKVRTPDLLILEAYLPKIDGLSLCRHIRTDLTALKFPILVFSCLDVKKEALEAGAADFLLKPFEEKSFARFVSPHLKLKKEESKS